MPQSKDYDIKGIDRSRSNLNFKVGIGHLLERIIEIIGTEQILTSTI
jgi:hypothetical protein